VAGPSRTAACAALRSALVDRAFKPGRGWRRNGNAFRWILDCREVLLDAHLLALACAELRPLLDDFAPDAVAGLGVAGATLVGGLVHDAGARGDGLCGLVVRDAKKQYGLRKEIEGPSLRPGSRVVVVDDVANSGKTLLRAIRLLRAEGHDVVGAAVLVDFRSRARLALTDAGVPLRAVLYLADLGIVERDPPPTANLDDIASWTYAGGNRRPYVVPHSSPVVADGRIVFGTDTGAVVALNPDGAQLWRSSLGAPAPAIYSTPLVVDDAVYVGADDGCLHRLALADGRIVWSVPCGELVGSSPAYAGGGRVVVGAAFSSDSGGLVGVEDDGTIAWRYPLTTYVHASPGVDVDAGVAVGADTAGCVAAVETVTGTLRWTYRTRSAVKGAIAAEAGLCIFGTWAGYLHCLDTETGDVRWARKLSTRFFAPPLLVDGIVIIGGASHLVAVDVATGSVSWVRSVPGRVRGKAAVVAGDAVIVGCGDGHILVCDLDTGATRAAVRGSPVLSSLAVVDDIVVVSSADGRVSGFPLQALPGRRMDRVAAGVAP
jgi:outer membrane protein assembly factor BamB/orotate phosphoribosyltransferase